MPYALPNHPEFDEHHWADWVELMCLADPDRLMTIGRITQEVMQRKRDLGEASDFDDVDVQELDQAELSDKWYLRGENWFKHLQFRAKHFGDGYPFTITDNPSTLERRKTISGHHKLYIALLMASNLRYFSSSQSDLTSSFELFCLEIFKAWLPGHAQVHLFGSNKLNKGVFTGHVFEKISKLAENLNEQVHAHITPDTFPPTDSGDHGLDLAAWIPSGDSTPGTITFFGQCACTPDWVQKQDSSAYEAWSGVMTLNSRPLNVVFIPYCMRSTSGAWHRPENQRHHVLVDRLRVMHFLHDSADALQRLPAFKAVDDCLNRSCL